MLDNDLYIDEPEDIAVSMEAAFIAYDVYYRRYGVRRIGQLQTPILTEVSKIVLPKDAILLYQPESESELGINQNHILLQDSERMIYVNHHIDLLEKIGNPRKAIINSGKLIREYLRRNRKTRILKNIERVIPDPKTLVVENFSLLTHLWIYHTHILNFYYRWFNIQSTMWKRSEVLASQFDRHQILMVTLPDHIPSISEFKRAESTRSKLTLESFQSNTALTLLDIWTWLGEHRDQSTLNSISKANLNKIHLVFIQSGVWSVVNLGLIDEWRESPGNLDTGEDSHTGVQSTVMQKYFLRFINTLFEYKNAGAKTISPVVNDAIKEEVQATTSIPTANTDPNDVQLNDVKQDTVKRLSLDRVTNPESNRPSSVKMGMTQQTVDRNKKIELVTTKPNPDIVNAMDTELDSLDHLFTAEVDSVIHDANDALPPLEKGIMHKADLLADEGLIGAAQYRRIEKLASKYKELPNPFGEGTLETLATVVPADTQLPDIQPLPDDDFVLDKSMLNTVIEEMDRKYLKVVMEKDIAAAVLNIQKAGVAVTKYDVEHIEDAMNDYNSYSIRLAPVNGNPSVVRFRLPKVQEDGSYLSNSIKCRLRSQRVDVPIRKINESTVALTSYYSKVFISRSEKAIHNYERWLYNNVILKLRDPESVLKAVAYSNTWNNNFTAPRIYSILAKRFRTMETKDKSFFFDFEKRSEFFGIDRITKLETDGRIVCGRMGNNLIVATMDDEFILVTDKEEIDLGTITDILEIEELKSPVEIAEMSILNKTIPLGIILSYLIGFGELLKLSGVKERRAVTGERIKLEPDEFAIKFIDETLIFSKRDKKATLLFGGFIPYKDVLSAYGVSTLNRKDIFYNVLDSKEIGLRYIREMDLMQDLYIDPITEGILKEMGEPTEYIPLLMRALDLLLTDWSPDETDMFYQRVRGYERFSGFVYQELIRAIRQHNANSMSMNAAIEIHPDAVWRNIDKDVSKYLIQESNPIHNLKEKETITFSGTGGRSSESMVKRSRVYHANDLGIVSEATPDNKSVGATAFLTPNPNFNSLRGTVKQLSLDEIQNSSLLSTSALVSPCSDTDSPARLNFVNIQHSAGISAKGYRAIPLRTGYEKMIAHRTDELFAYTAKKEGTIVSVEADQITVEYKDGERKTVELGRRFGISEGTTIPHELVTGLVVGDTVTTGDAIAYNRNYFEADYFNPKRVNLKLGTLAKTAILESADTFEDSSAISERLADQMSTKITKVRNIVTKFDQVIRNLVKPGQSVDLSSILCTIEDPITASNQLFDDESISALKGFSANTPKAKYSGVVERIEVFYNGDKSDMSESLREIANTADRQMKRLSVIKGKEKTITGAVDNMMRVDGSPLDMDSLVIKVYITADVTANVGDKFVFGNQMKSICGRVMSSEVKTESGEVIDATFSLTSIGNRQCNSPISMGLTNSLLKLISLKAVEIYKGK